MNALMDMKAMDLIALVSIVSGCIPTAPNKHKDSLKCLHLTP